MDQEIFDIKEENRVLKDKNQELERRLLTLENRLNGLSNDQRQIEVIRDSMQGGDLSVRDFQVKGDVGFYGKDPLPQQDKIDDPSGGVTVDSSARSKINEIIDVLEALGLTSET